MINEHGKHLNWDNTNLNGIVSSEKYPEGAMFVGAENKPVLSVDYEEFEYSQRGQFREHNYISVVTHVDGSYYAEKLPISDELEQEILAIIDSWEQPLGSEGNPTDEQIAEHVKFQVASALEQTDRYMVEDYPIANREELIQFRQALRDVNLQPGFPREVEWPVFPEIIKKERTHE